MKQNVALSILTPFSSKKKKKKMRRCRPKNKNKNKKKQKNKNGGGGLRGVWKLLFYGIIWVLYTFFTNAEANVHIFEVKEFIFQGFEKIKPFVFSKMLVLPQIKLRGRFCGCAQNPFNFLCFVNVEWKIDHSEVHSENLSTLHLFVWP